MPLDVLWAFHEGLTLPDPRYVAAVKQAGPTGRMSPTLTLYREWDEWVVLPRA